MLPLEVRKYLFDIQQACDLLAQFAAAKTFEDYKADAMLRSAIERQFEIVGEALRQALRRVPELATHITDHQRIIAFRNRLIHGYAGGSPTRSSGASSRPACPSYERKSMRCSTRRD